MCVRQAKFRVPDGLAEPPSGQFRSGVVEEQVADEVVLSRILVEDEDEDGIGC